MKRTIIALIALVAATLPSLALSPDRIIDKFRNSENADYVHVPKFLIKLGLASAAKDVPMAGNVSGITVLDLSGASAATRNEFVDDVDKITGYETLVSATDGGEKVRILTKPKGDKFEDFVIVCIDSTDCSMVKFSGKFSQKEINELIEENSKK